MRGNFKIAKRHIVKEGKWEDNVQTYHYVIYTTKLHQMVQLRINALYYLDEEGVYHCDGAYDGFLCETMEEYEKLTDADIKDAVYRAWCGGAR